MAVDKQDARQSDNQPLKAQTSQNDAFISHLERASAVVQTWPAWKQQLLGGTAVTVTQVPIQTFNTAPGH